MTEKYTDVVLKKALAARGFPPDAEVKLDIGAGGPSADSSFLSVDLFTEADILATMWDIPIPDNSVDAIYCSNAMEHISKFQIIPTLREFNRILKLDGHLLLIVPDLEWACKWWLDHPDTSWNMDILYGNQGHDGEYHKTGFTKKILFKYFMSAGGLKIVDMNFFGGTNELVVRDSDLTNLLAEVVEQREIMVKAIKVANWNETKTFAMGFGKELSTEMTAPGSLDPLFSVDSEQEQ